MYVPVTPRSSRCPNCGARLQPESCSSPGAHIAIVTGLLIMMAMIGGVAFLAQSGDRIAGAGEASAPIPWIAIAMAGLVPLSVAPAVLLARARTRGEAERRGGRPRDDGDSSRTAIIIAVALGTLGMVMIGALLLFQLA